MAISYCSLPNNIFCYTTGTGIPEGSCLYRGELMLIQEAECAGIRDGSRIEFRSTESFWRLLDNFYKFYGADKVREKAISEELDPEETLLTVIARFMNIERA